MTDQAQQAAPAEQAPVAAQQTATQPTTPAVPQVPAQQPQVPEQVHQAPVDYTGSTALETSLNVFSASVGIDASLFDQVTANALKYNDVNLIDYTALVQGLKPEQAAQAKALATAAFKEQQTFISNQAAQVHTLAGSKEAWDLAAQAFNQSAPAHIQAVVRHMLDTGDMVNAAKFVLETVNQSGLVNNGTPPVQGGTGAVQQGLSLQEFHAELHKLNMKAGNRSLESGALGAEYQALLQARAIGKKQGR